MAWTPIPMGNGNPHPYWEYENTSTTLGAVAGVRQFKTGTEVYVQVRRIGTSVTTAGEISKTFWDNHAVKIPIPEPTLSLTFDGTESSFYNLSWSE